MPLFRVLDEDSLAKAERRRKRKRNVEWTRTSRRLDEDDSVLSLSRLCLLSLANNMSKVWTKDYTDKYLDHYSFRYIMGPFNVLRESVRAGDLVEELMLLLCSRKELSRAALHLLLVPQLHNLSLESCPGLVTSDLCGHISARCQGLWNLDLSGAQQLPLKVLCKTLHGLPSLRSLGLAGIPCDRFVINTITICCRLLRHLDVSRCHLLSPSALLPLGGGPRCSSSPSPCGSSSSCASPSQPSVSSPSSSSSSASSTLPLRSLLALDIGFEEKEGDAVAAAAYLLLSLPSLERLALERITQACSLIEQKEFSQTEEFTDREGVPRLEDLWAERSKQEGKGWKQMRTRDNREDEDEEEEERMLWGESGSESEEDASSDKVPFSPEKQTEETLSSQSGLILQLRDVKGLTCDSLDSLSRLCPSISALSVNINDDDDVDARSGGRTQSSVLAAGLQSWSGQLRSLSVQFPGRLVDLFPALKIAGPSLASLTLEGVKTSVHTPLLEVITTCHRLRELAISAEPPATTWDWVDPERFRHDGNLPKLPNLCSLSINFSYEHNQPKPAMSWMSLKMVLQCLLNGSPLLEKVSLVSLPCPLNNVLWRMLLPPRKKLPRFPEPAGSAASPLTRLQHINLLRTDVMMSTLQRLIDRSKNLKYIDVSYCWNVSQRDWANLNKSNKVQFVWV